MDISFLVPIYSHLHITDFGMSKNFETGHSHSQTTFGGTLFYEAPEILRGEKYGIEVDIYSFAILMFEVLTDSVPYPKIESSELAVSKFIDNVVNRSYRPKFTFPIKKSLQVLIERCWSDDPKERPTFGQIFEKLSNRNNCNEGEDFLLDDVDIDEVNLYIEDISEVTDHIENLMNRIHQMENEIKELKNENNKLKNENMIQRDKIEKYEKDMMKIWDEINETKEELKECKKEMKKLKNQLINNTHNLLSLAVIINSMNLEKTPTIKIKMVVQSSLLQLNCLSIFLHFYLIQ